MNLNEITEDITINPESFNTFKNLLEEKTSVSRRLHTESPVVKKYLRILNKKIEEKINELYVSTGLYNRYLCQYALISERIG